MNLKINSFIFSRRSEVLIKVFNAGFIPVLSNIATHNNFDIRKEAAYGLINIASHGVEFMRSLPHQELLPGKYQRVLNT